MLEIEVFDVCGYCPVHKVGDRITIEGPRIVPEETDALCVHALSTLLHYVVALDNGVDPVKLGLTTSKEKDVAYLQCLDPGKPFTHGGTVIFRCKKL